MSSLTLGFALYPFAAAFFCRRGVRNDRQTEVGFFDKQIAVRTNAAEKMVFRITGNVLIE